MKRINSTTLRASQFSVQITALKGLALVLCLLTLSIITARASDDSSGPSTKIEAEFSGAVLNGLIPRGEAELETFADGNRKFEVEAQNINLPDGTLLSVFVDGIKIGNITLTGLLGELELKTINGQTIPEVNSRTRVAIIDQAGNTIIAGSFSNIPPAGASPTPTPSPNPSGATRLEARLAGASIGGLLPKGHAKFEVRLDGRRKLNVEVEKVNLPTGTVLNVLVDNVTVGAITLTSMLENELELDTEKGNAVPNVQTLSTIVVTDAQGRTILSGTFNTIAQSIRGNDIDDDDYFVQQQYRDFLDREADDKGLDFWKQQLTNCADDSGCKDRARVNTSAAFFLSIEFQDTGYLLYRLNRASFNAMPRRNDFMIEMQAAAQGVVVGAPGWQQKLEDNKRLAAERWVNRQDFRDRFEHLTNDQFVDQLFANAGVRPGETEREDLIRGLNAGSDSRSSVLRKIAENGEFKRKEMNPAFVLMQYFGYLHRNPDEGADHDFSGFNFWLNKLNEHGGNFEQAEMVKAFIVSGEYRSRFDW